MKEPSLAEIKAFKSFYGVHKEAMLIDLIRVHLMLKDAILEFKELVVPFRKLLDGIENANLANGEVIDAQAALDKLDEKLKGC